MYSQRMRECRRPKFLRRGATLVEFAVVVPILFFLLVLFVEFGRYIVTVHALEEASRVDCRIAVLEDSITNEVEVAVADLLKTFSIYKYDMSITPNLRAAIGAGDPVTVRINVDYKDVSWLPAPRTLRDKTLSVSNTTPKEN